MRRDNESPAEHKGVATQDIGDRRQDTGHTGLTASLCTGNSLVWPTWSVSKALKWFFPALIYHKYTPPWVCDGVPWVWRLTSFLKDKNDKKNKANPSCSFLGPYKKVCERNFFLEAVKCEKKWCKVFPLWFFMWFCKNCTIKWHVLVRLVMDMYCRPNWYIIGHFEPKKHKN